MKFTVMKLVALFLSATCAWADGVGKSCEQRLTADLCWRAELRVEFESDKPDLPFSIEYSAERMLMRVSDGRTWYIDGDRCTFFDGDVCLLLDTGPFFETLRGVAALASERFEHVAKDRLEPMIPRRVPALDVRFGSGDSLAFVVGAGLDLDNQGRRLHASWLEELAEIKDEPIAGLYMLRDDDSLLAVTEKTGFLHELVRMRNGERVARVRTLAFNVQAGPFTAPDFGVVPDTLQLLGNMRSEALRPLLGAMHREVLAGLQPGSNLDELRSFWQEVYGAIYQVSFGDKLVRYSVEKSFEQLEPKLAEISALVAPEHYELGLRRMSELVVELSRRHLLGEARSISLTAGSALEDACHELKLDASLREELLVMQVELLYGAVQLHVLEPAQLKAEALVAPLLKKP